MGDDQARNLAQRLQRRLAEQGHHVPIDSTPEVFTQDEWTALERGEAIVRIEALEEHPEFIGYEASTSAEEYVAGEEELAALEERGGTLMEGRRDPNSPEWQAHCARSSAWRNAILEGRDPGPKPEPPPRPALRDDPRVRAFCAEKAAERRARVRPLKRQIVVDRAKSSRAALRFAPRRTPAPRPRARRPAARRALGPRSGSDPPDDEDPERPSPRRRREPRHLSHALAAALEELRPAELGGRP